MRSNGSTFTGVTLNGNANVNAGATLTVRGNLTLGNGSTLTVGADATLTFDNQGSGDQTILVPSGTATIATTGKFRQFGTSHTVTFGAGLTVQGLATFGELGNNHVTGTWANAGTMLANVNTRGFIFGDYSTYLNLSGGVWEA